MRIGIFGAGAVGCYFGGRLAAQDNAVTLVGRPAIMDEIRRVGLTVTAVDETGPVRAQSSLTLATEAAALSNCDIVLVTVKGPDTSAVGKELAPHLRAGCAVVSLQNGVRNAALLRDVLPGVEVVGGMVPFAVQRKDAGLYHRGSGGVVMVMDGPVGRQLAAKLQAAGIPTRARPDILEVQWGKLLFNLNNAVNALAGIPLAEELRERGYRRVMSAAMREGLRALRRAGIKPATILKAPPMIVPSILESPDWVFRLVAGGFLPVHPGAKSSMLQDLEQGRRTEIDELCGEVVDLASRFGTTAPVNQALLGLIRTAQDLRQGSPGLSPNALLSAVGL